MNDLAMKYQKLKESLQDKIDYAKEEWDRLSKQQKSTILQGAMEAKNGLVTPLSDVNKPLRKKYGLNGKESVPGPKTHIS